MTLKIEQQQTIKKMLQGKIGEQYQISRLDGELIC